MSRALFFPFPGNLGPLVNCCAIADELATRNWTVGFLYSNENRHIIQDNLREAIIYETSGPPSRLAKAWNETPRFRTMCDLDDFAYLFQFDNHDWLCQTLEEQLKAIQLFKPDIIVGSWTFLTGVVGEISDIPVVQIFQAPMLSSARGFRWWGDDPPRSASKCVPIINVVLRAHGIPEISCVEELTSKGDLFVIPSLPEIDPTPSDFPNAHYVGHLTWLNKTERELPTWLTTLNPDIPIIYAYDGGRKYGNRVLDLLIRVFANTNTCVVFSAGSEHDSVTLPPKPANFRFEYFVPSYHTTSRSKLVVSHGAIGTDMCCLLNGVPSIMIPTNSEREYYSRRIEVLGAGKSINFDRLDFETFTAACETLAIDPTFAANASALGMRAEALGGPARAADLIEQYLNS
jgi:UDP:flavonoid glycosyltransferase YjiC (YdhE family)